ncbi:MAG: hypothetical protein JWM75_480 [Sphingomonas bacterium]|nr:hypothetical protein [Sphingomonas bacterium]
MRPDAEALLQSAVNAVHRGERLHEALDQLPAAVYVADRDGLVTHFNQACVALRDAGPLLSTTDGASRGNCSRQTAKTCR